MSDLATIDGTTITILHDCTVSQSGAGTFARRATLKAKGWKWDPIQRQWSKEITAGRYVVGRDDTLITARRPGGRTETLWGTPFRGGNAPRCDIDDRAE